MKVQGRKVAEWGFTVPENGWHVVEMLENINYAKDKDTGEIKTDKKGEKKWAFPCKISDDKDVANGARLFPNIYENNFGEQMVADILTAIKIPKITINGKECSNMFEAIDAEFPGDHSFFESAIMDKIKIKLPNKFLKMRTEVGKDGKNVSVTGVTGLDVEVEDKKVGKKTEVKTDTAETSVVKGW